MCGREENKPSGLVVVGQFQAVARQKAMFSLQEGAYGSWSYEKSQEAGRSLVASVAVDDFKRKEVL